ncbi:MAG: hypothetical protein K2O06_18415 [Acetatifactor sp.]|nr:hypothetical protein [Acetatifactor sp.]
MIFAGTTFCSGRHTLSPPPSPLSGIAAIQLFDGTYDHLLLSADPDAAVDEFDSGWTYNTKINANFEENLEAGNIGFSTKTTENLVVRRREAGTYDWTVIYVKKIQSADDFDIVLRDTYARAGVEYEYSLSSFCNGIENSYVVQKVYSDFEGFYITDKDCLYGTIYDVDGCDTNRNISSQTLNLLNSRYLTTVSNGGLNCDSGSISGTFLKTDQTGPDLLASLKYRNEFKNRLADHKPLILKIDDGRIWMIKVSSNPTDTAGGHRDIRRLQFEWVEIGSVNSMKDLYMNGFSDVDSRWW